MSPLKYLPNENVCPLGPTEQAGTRKGRLGTDWGRGELWSRRKCVRPEASDPLGDKDGKSVPSGKDACSRHLRSPEFMRAIWKRSSHKGLCFSDDTAGYLAGSVRAPGLSSQTEQVRKRTERPSSRERRAKTIPGHRRHVCGKLEVTNTHTRLEPRNKCGTHRTHNGQEKSVVVLYTNDGKSEKEN